MKNTRYAIVTPAHNEEKFLPQVIEAITRQKILPVRWIIVDDRSTDDTLAVIQKYAARYPFIQALHLSGDTERSLGANVVQVFNAGLAKLDEDVDYIIKMDADLILEPDYFTDMMTRFEADPKLGIGSGKIFIEHGGEWIQERYPDFHVPGACKMYRMACFRDIGGPIIIYGWDILDGTKARMLGWTTCSFRDLSIRHLRMMGSAKGMLRGHIGHGRGMYAVRAHPVFVLARSVYRAVEPPFLSGLLIFFGYIYGWLKGEPRLKDLKLARFLRKEQLGRLLGRKLSQEAFLPRKLNS
ncbi:Glycosyl transferase, family II [Desulfonema limicola]|uniref:Glycosyl transferase, family II n=1 Tax=Desulfonema limicola TaxID=45656 RepID=A0A975GJ68_9BACT|nr:glycosyltransferase family A protein [Desulfonema limicola]QTA83321.1 Glycosyl transferase, family II [Desulfonema limicola]